MNTERTHRILLANFKAAQSEQVRKAGFNVETGYVGTPQVGHQKPYVPFYSPHPLYDYDVYVLSLEEAGEPPSECRNLQPEAVAVRPPALRIVFLGGSAGPSLLPAAIAKVWADVTRRLETFSFAREI